MNTTNNQPTAHEIAAALSVEELNTLNNIDFGYQEFYPKALRQINILAAKGLITYYINESNYIAELTDLGLAVLEACASAPVAGKPTEIFWREFKNQDNPVYLAWVHNECVVRFNERKIEHIFSEASVKLEDWAYEETMLDKYLLHIKWLAAPQPAPSQPVSATAEGSEAEDEFGENVTVTPTEMTVKELVMLKDHNGLVAEYHGKEILLINDQYEDMAWPIYYADGSSESVTYNTRVQIRQTGYLNMTAMPTAVHHAKSIIAALRAQNADKDIELSALRDQNARLRTLCGRAADAMDDMVLCEMDTALYDELLKAAGGEG